MTEQEAFEAWWESANSVSMRVTAEDAWNAALAWLCSQGEPIATLHDDGYWTWKNRANAPHESNYAGWRMDVFAAPQPAIPDGWQLVPVEPTEEMCLAYTKCKTEAGEKWARHQWAAMLAAAPEPSK